MLFDLGYGNHSQSFPPKRESSFYAVFWIPAFAGVTLIQKHCRGGEGGEDLVQALRSSSCSFLNLS